MSSTSTAPEASTLEAIKAKQNAVWSSGDYAVLGTTLQITGESLAETMDLHPSSKVLDVAAGNGNATMAFARRWCNVTSTDYVPALLDRGRARAEAEGHTITFQVADAEALPFDGNSFDAVVSTFGVMFTPDQPKAAGELMRVCRPGGKIGMANWTADGFVGQLFKLVGGHVPPPAGIQPPVLWASKEWLHETFRDAARITIAPRDFTFRYRSADHFIDTFRTWYGPVHKAFQALDDAGQASLEAGMRALIDSMNVATDGSMKVPGRYAEVVIVKS